MDDFNPNLASWESARKQAPALGSVSPGASPFTNQSGLAGENFTASYTKPDGTTIYGYNTASLPGQQPLGSGVNDTTQTNKYLSALNTYGDMHKTGIEMERGPQAQSALPGSQWTPQQMQGFFSALGSMLNSNPATGTAGQTGLNQLFGGINPSPSAPQMVAGDNSRYANDPFKVNSDALR